MAKRAKILQVLRPGAREVKDSTAMRFLWWHLRPGAFEWDNNAGWKVKRKSMVATAQKMEPPPHNVRATWDAHQWRPLGLDTAEQPRELKSLHTRDKFKPPTPKSTKKRPQQEAAIVEHLRKKRKIAEEDATMMLTVMRHDAEMAEKDETREVREKELLTANAALRAQVEDLMNENESNKTKVANYEKFRRESLEAKKRAEESRKAKIAVMKGRLEEQSRHFKEELGSLKDQLKEATRRFKSTDKALKKAQDDQSAFQRKIIEARISDMETMLKMATELRGECADKGEHIRWARFKEPTSKLRKLVKEFTGWCSVEMLDLCFAWFHKSGIAATARVRGVGHASPDGQGSDFEKPGQVRDDGSGERNMVVHDDEDCVGNEDDDDETSWVGAESGTLRTSSSHGVLSFEDRILIGLVVLRTGMTQKVVAGIFGVNASTVSRCFTFTLAIFRDFFDIIAPDPTKEVLEKTCPAYLKKRWDGQTISFWIDATEIPIEVPECKQLQKVAYSDYKGRCTAKFLGGLTTSGCMTFTSSAFPGSLSDPVLTQVSGFVDRCVFPKQVIGADKGFLIYFILAEKGSTLLMPPRRRHKKGGKKGEQQQLSEEEAKQQYKIANDRIHVERFFAALKSWRWFRKIPVSSVDLLSMAFRVAVMITNMNSPPFRGRGKEEPPLVGSAFATIYDRRLEVHRDTNFSMWKRPKNGDLAARGQQEQEEIQEEQKQPEEVQEMQRQ